MDDKQAPARLMNGRIFLLLGALCFVLALFFGIVDRTTSVGALPRGYQGGFDKVFEAFAALLLPLGIIFYVAHKIELRLMDIERSMRDQKGGS